MQRYICLVSGPDMCIGNNQTYSYEYIHITASAPTVTGMHASKGDIQIIFETLFSFLSVNQDFYRIEEDL